MYTDIFDTSALDTATSTDNVPSGGDTPGTNSGSLWSSLNGFLDTAASTYKTIAGTPVVTAGTPAGTAAPAKSNTMLYLAIGAGVLLVVGMFILRRR